MNNLDKKFPEETAKTNKINQNDEKTSEKLGNALSQDNAVLEMIGNIENENIRATLERSLNEEDKTAEEIKEEIEIYNNEIKPRLSDSELDGLFNRLAKDKKLPSGILKEFGIRDEILNESDPEVNKLMKQSLGMLLPSVILENKEIYEKFAKVEEADEKGIISYYFKAGFSPKSVNDEYEDYVEIKNYENDDVKKLALAYIATGKMPSLAMFYIDLFKKIAEYGEETKNYIIGLIEEGNGCDSVETLLGKAHYYKSKH